MTNKPWLTDFVIVFFIQNLMYIYMTRFVFVVPRICKLYFKQLNELGIYFTTVNNILASKLEFAETFCTLSRTFKDHPVIYPVYTIYHVI